MQGYSVTILGNITKWFITHTCYRQYITSLKTISFTGARHQVLPIWTECHQPDHIDVVLEWRTEVSIYHTPCIHNSLYDCLLLSGPFERLISKRRKRWTNKAREIIDLMWIWDIRVKWKNLSVASLKMFVSVTVRWMGEGRMEFLRDIGNSVFLRGTRQLKTHSLQ